MTLIIDEENQDQTVISQYESIITNSKLPQETIHQKVSFRLAGIYSDPVEDHVPNFLPILLLLDRNTNQKSTFFWEPTQLLKMLLQISKEENPHQNKDYWNLNQVKTSEL